MIELTHTHKWLNRLAQRILAGSQPKTKRRHKRAAHWVRSGVFESADEKRVWYNRSYPSPSTPVLNTSTGLPDAGDMGPTHHDGGNRYEDLLLQYGLNHPGSVIDRELVAFYDPIASTLIMEMPERVFSQPFHFYDSSSPIGISQEILVGMGEFLEQIGVTELAKKVTQMLLTHGWAIITKELEIFSARGIRDNYMERDENNAILSYQILDYNQPWGYLDRPANLHPTSRSIPAQEVLHLQWGGDNKGFGYSLLKGLWDPFTKLREESHADSMRKRIYPIVTAPDDWDDDDVDNFMEDVANMDHNRCLVIYGTTDENFKASGLPNIVWATPASGSANISSGAGSMYGNLSAEWTRISSKTGFSARYFIGDPGGALVAAEANLSADHREEIIFFNQIAKYVIKPLLAYLAKIGSIPEMPIEGYAIKSWMEVYQYESGALEMQNEMMMQVDPNKSKEQKKNGMGLFRAWEILNGRRPARITTPGRGLEILWGRKQALKDSMDQEEGLFQLLTSIQQRPGLAQIQKEMYSPENMRKVFMEAAQREMGLNPEPETEESPEQPETPIPTQAEQPAAVKPRTRDRQPYQPTEFPEEITRENWDKVEIPEEIDENAFERTDIEPQSPLQQPTEQPIQAPTGIQDIAEVPHEPVAQPDQNQQLIRDLEQKVESHRVAQGIPTPDEALAQQRESIMASQPAEAFPVQGQALSEQLQEGITEAAQGQGAPSQQPLGQETPAQRSALAGAMEPIVEGVRERGMISGVPVQPESSTVKQFSVNPHPDGATADVNAEFLSYPGQIYTYDNVPLGLAENLLSADSKGSFIAHNFRGTHPGRSYPMAPRQGNVVPGGTTGSLQHYTISELPPPMWGIPTEGTQVEQLEKEGRELEVADTAYSQAYQRDALQPGVYRPPSTARTAIPTNQSTPNNAPPTAPVPTSPSGNGGTSGSSGGSARIGRPSQGIISRVVSHLPVGQKGDTALPAAASRPKADTQSQISKKKSTGLGIQQKMNSADIQAIEQLQPVIYWQPPDREAPITSICALKDYFGVGKETARTIAETLTKSPVIRINSASVLKVDEIAYSNAFNADFGMPYLGIDGSLSVEYIDPDELPKLVGHTIPIGIKHNPDGVSGMLLESQIVGTYEFTGVTADGKRELGIPHYDKEAIKNACAALKIPDVYTSKIEKGEPLHLSHAYLTNRHYSAKRRRIEHTDVEMISTSILDEDDPARCPPPYCKLDPRSMPDPE